jgi:hypothetical protein
MIGRSLVVQMLLKQGRPSKQRKEASTAIRLTRLFPNNPAVFKANSELPSRLSAVDATVFE